MNRASCIFPKAIKSICDSGCIYRERNFKHLRCPLAKKVDICAAPCPIPCDCGRKTQCGVVTVKKEVHLSSSVSVRKYTV